MSERENQLRMIGRRIDLEVTRLLHIREGVKTDEAKTFSDLNIAIAGLRTANEYIRSAAGEKTEPRVQEQLFR